MWQVYHYGHGKLKLAKDLKTGQAHLRVSLIDQEEIANMGRIYNERKNYYKIDSEAYTAPTFMEEDKEEQATSHLTYKQKVDLYRKRLQNEKLQSKYNSLFKKAEKRRYKMRNPILYKMLEQFQEQYKHEDSLQIRGDLKESEKNLELIKINTNRKAQFQIPSEESDVHNSRPRFISLQNGLPEKQTQQLPTWIDYLEGKISKPTKTSPTINISQLESAFDAIIGGHSVKPKKTRKQSRDHPHYRDIHSPARDKANTPKQINLSDNMDKNTKQSHFFQEKNQKEDNRKELNLVHHSSFSSKFQGRRAVSKPIETRRNFPKSEQNVSIKAEKTFAKSQNFSKGIISTMSNFYKTKSHHKQDYEQMVFHLKKDRPLTSDIRRKTYRVISEDNIQDIKKYRSMSEQERMKLKHKNYEFYLSLLKKLEGHHNEEMRLSPQLLERLRTVLSSNYIISQQHFQFIAQPSLLEPSDDMSEYILEQLDQFIKKQHQK